MSLSPGSSTDCVISEGFLCGCATSSSSTIQFHRCAGRRFRRRSKIMGRSVMSKAKLVTRGIRRPRREQLIGPGVQLASHASSLSRSADAKDAGNEQDDCNSVYDRADHSLFFDGLCDDSSQRAVRERTAACRNFRLKKPGKTHEMRSILLTNRRIKGPPVEYIMNRCPVGREPGLGFPHLQPCGLRRQGRACGEYSYSTCQDHEQLADEVALRWISNDMLRASIDPAPDLLQPCNIKGIAFNPCQQPV